MASGSRQHGPCAHLAVQHEVGAHAEQGHREHHLGTDGAHLRPTTRATHEAPRGRTKAGGSRGRCAESAQVGGRGGEGPTSQEVERMLMSSHTECPKHSRMYDPMSKLAGTLRLCANSACAPCTHERDPMHVCPHTTLRNSVLPGSQHVRVCTDVVYTTHRHVFTYKSMRQGAPS